MRTLIFLTTFFFVAIALALAAAAGYAWVTSPATEAARQADVQYWIQRGELDLAFRQAIFPAVVVAASATIISLPAVALALGWYLVKLITRLIRRRGQLVYPDKRGLLPADRARLQQGDYDAAQAMALAGHHTAKITAAAHPPLPAPVEGSRVIYHQHADAGRGQAERQAQALPAPPTSLAFEKPPSLARLLAWGDIGPGKPLLLGYTRDAGNLLQPITATMKDAYSIAVAGVPGSGKTVTTAYLAAQTALQGAKLLVVDPHADAQGSLAEMLLCLRPALLDPPATDEADILRVLQVARDEIARRKQGATGAPWVLVADEWTSLMRRARVSDLLAGLVELVAQEGRKLGVNLLVAGQVWTVDAAGGSPLRDAIASAIVHRSKPQQARALIPTAGKEVAKLPPGEGLLYRTNGDLVDVLIPMTTRADLEQVARMLPAPAPARQPDRRPSSGASDDPSWGGSFRIPPVPAPVLTPRRHDDAGDVVDQVDEEPPAGAPVLRVIRGGMEGGNVGELGGEAEALGVATGPQMTAPAPTYPSSALPTTPPARPLILKARDARLELSEEEWATLAELDRGKSPQTIAREKSGRDGGRTYSRLRDEVARLRDFVATWPDGEVWATGAPARPGGEAEGA